MNKFNLGLHSAFFDLDSELRAANERMMRDTEKEIEKEIENTTRVAAEELKAEVEWDTVDSIFGPWYSNAVLTEIFNRERNNWVAVSQEKLKTIRSRMLENSQQWEKNIKEGYKHLLKTLLDNKYFNNPSAKKVDKIKEMYINEVKSQYEKHVWKANDKTFDQTKGELFWQKMPDYPANVIYKNLNDNAEIFASEVWNKQAYTVEAHNTENFDANLQKVKTQEWGDKKRFLAKELPNYLWETKDTTWFSRIAQYTPIVSETVRRVSEMDKKWLEDFMDVVEKISVVWWENPELALLEVFKDAQTNWTETQWKENLKEKKIILSDDRYLRKIIRAGRFYVNSQKVDVPVEQQHNLYLSIIGAIEHEWWIDRAIARFMDDVKESREARIEETKKQNDKDWKTLEEANKELFDIADKFNKRYTRALRLSEMDENSFQNRNAVDILADLNNDWDITYADRWATKTWFEFKRIAGMVGEKDAIKHLLEQAKLLNETMKLGLSEDDLKEEEIKKWNKKLILALQNIISQPWGDLYPLLVYGTDSAKKYKEAFDRLPQSKEDPAVQAAAQELLKDIKVEDLQKIEWVDHATDLEWLRQAVAWRLFAEYTRWIWLGGTASFDEWVKWVSLSGWVQVSESWLSAWLTLGYNPEIDLWKWRSITPGASFWFVPLFHATVWWSVEVAKKWIDDKSVAQKIWIRWWFTRIFGVSDVYSASIGWSRDKLAGIEWDRRNIEWQFNNQIMSPLMKSIADKLWDNKVLNLKDEAVRSKVEEAISAQVESVLNWEDKSKLKQWDKEKLIDNTMRFLSFFDNADLSNEGVRNAIASKMAEQYAYAREDSRLNDIDGKTYLSGARLWFSWVRLWVYWVWVLHAWLSFTKHEHDIYGDRSYGRHGMSAERFKSYSSWNEEMVAEFNKSLPEGKKIEWNPEWYVVIPQNLFRDAFINPWMHWNIKKDEKGNILLHPETRIDLPTVTVWTATQSVKINIGWFDRGMVKLNTLTNDWFTDSIDSSKLTGKEDIFTKERLNQKLDELKANPIYKEDQDLKNYEFGDDVLSQLEMGKRYHIILRKDWKWITPEVKVVPEGKHLTIEYRPLDKVPLVSEEAKNIAKGVYAEALKVTSNALYNISHDRGNRLNSEYRKFANAVKDQNYEDAKATILAMLPKMKDYINQYQQKNNQIDFSRNGEGEVNVIDTLKKLEWAELGKALMSINNVFARVSSVHGGTDWVYHFKRYDSVEHKLLDRDMWSIVEARAKEISWKIDRSGLDAGAIAAYKNLISFAEDYRTKNPDKYSDTSKQARTLENAIWINLWNAISIENPLFNPEVYSDSVIDSKELKFDWADTLKGRALSVVAWNKALMSPILLSLWFKDDAQVKVLSYDEKSWQLNLEVSHDEKNWQLNLDINRKNVILKADMKFAYFAQCVNHMLILDSISAEIPGESRKVEFGPSVMWDGTLYEASKGEAFSSSTGGGDVAVEVYSNIPGPETETETETPTPTPTPSETPPEDNPGSKPWSDPTEIPDDVTTKPTENPTVTPPENPTTTPTENPTLTPTPTPPSDDSSNENDWI